MVTLSKEVLLTARKPRPKINQINSSSTDLCSFRKNSKQWREVPRDILDSIYVQSKMYNALSIIRHKR